MTLLDHIPFANHRTCAEWGPEHDAKQFAEELANHGNVARAARAVRQTEAWGRLQLAAMCKQLGIAS